MLARQPERSLKREGRAPRAARVESAPMPASSPAPTRRSNPVLALLGRALESALNRAISLDPETRGRIAALDGRAVTLDFAGSSGRPAPAMRLVVDGERLRVGPASGGDSALTVAATPATLVALALAHRRGAHGGDDALAPGRVQVAGDAELARRLEQIANRFQPDFDEAFARAFGDIAGPRIARTLRAALAWTRESAGAFARDAAEFLTEEGRDLVARAELDRFLDDVDAVRERADRLAARVDRLRRGARA